MVKLFSTLTVAVYTSAYVGGKLQRPSHTHTDTQTEKIRIKSVGYTSINIL